MIFDCEFHIKILFLPFSYPELRIPSITALINLLGPVQDATNELNKSFRIDRIDEPSRLPALLENAGQFLINSCGEATFLLRNIELEDAVVMCNNLWTNMMNRMKGNSDPTLTELLVQNLTILANEVSCWLVKEIKTLN